MSDFMVIENSFGPDGVRRVHVMGSADLTPSPFPSGKGGAVAEIMIPGWAELKTWEDEIRLHHLAATWRARDLSPAPFPKGAGGHQNISDGAVDAALVFFGTFEFWPSAAWVRTWPRGLREEDAWIPITEDYGMDLFAVDWVGEGFVVVGGGFYRGGMARQNGGVV